MTKRLFSILLSAIVIIACVSSCGQNVSNKNNLAVGVDVKGDTLQIQPNQAGAFVVSYSIMGKPFKTKSCYGAVSLDMKQLVREDADLINEYAYKIATTGSLPIRFTIGEQLDTTVKLGFNTKAIAYDTSTRITSGPCVRLSLKGVSSSQESDIKKWLFNRGTHADDETIHKMAEALNLLTASTYNEYVPEEGQTIPVLTSFKGAKYKITTNIKSDYYYLFAATKYAEINDFLAEVISQNFSYAETTASASFSCFRPSDKGGLLTIFLIAVNKDWSKTIIPVGLVSIDNLKPTVASDNRLTGDLDLSALLKKGGETSDNNYLVIQELNDKVNFPSIIPEITGHVTVTTGQFRGDNAQFTISFSGDVESMTIKREIHRSYSWLSPGTKTITFSGQSSPIHFTYALDLGIGDNYIPITIKDKRGNTNSFSYHIEMVQVEKTNPEINIDNNIDIWN